jgi:hypothetical protein
MSTKLANGSRPGSAIMGVYGLEDPRTGRIRYVGQSIDIKFRYRRHLDASHYCGNRLKANWIAGLRELGLYPRLVTLGECRNLLELDELEKATIERLQEVGQADLNLTAGGDSPLKRSAEPDDWHQLFVGLAAARAHLVEAANLASPCAGSPAISHVETALRVLDSRVVHLRRLMVRSGVGIGGEVR